MRFLDRMDPEIAAVLDNVPLLDIADIPTARVERAELAAAARARWQPSGRVGTEDTWISGYAGSDPVRVRLHRPKEAATDAPCLLWVHGGGHVLGEADQDDPLLDDLVATTGCVAAAVDWRRAPEHPFPAALHDCYATLAWLHESAGDLGVDRGKVVLGGASSGGGLAAGTALMARDVGELRVAAQVLVYPMLDDRGVTASGRAVTHRRLWNVDSNRLAWQAYLGGAGPVSPYAAPSRCTDLSGLPWTWLATAELDLFADEDVAYASRLMEAGVSTELHVYRGAVHGFDLFAPDARVSRRFVRDRREAFISAFAQTAPSATG